jgi:hypothetical protein
MLADEAAFADYFPSNESALRAWNLVDEALVELRTRATLVQRLRANLSLKSFVRQLSPRDQVRLVQGAFTFNEAHPGGSESNARGMTGSLLMSAVRGLFDVRRHRE